MAPPKKRAEVLEHSDPDRTLIGAERGMKNSTRLDGRRTQHVGVLSDGLWTAHDRRGADNGVRAHNQFPPHEEGAS